MPEAAEGGPLALVANGDTIEIDLAAGRLDLVVADEEIARRRAVWAPPPPTAERGWLYQYRKLVRPLARGAVLCRDDDQGREPT